MNTNPSLYGLYTARTGAEFYTLVNDILSHRIRQGPLPVLDTYLGSLWHLISNKTYGK
jgi:hypothetical protein